MKSDVYNPDIEIGRSVHGFRVLRREFLESQPIIFYELIHEGTGARHIHLSTADDNNVFMVLFRTLPTDSTGVAHILEHAVLEGSHHYPVKIFKNLSGRSLNTFLNAMTSADYTGYPFSSRNQKDYYNLLDLYLDATFFPLLRKETFLQEGWRYEFAKPDDPQSPLMYKGVVYNEMKGAMSSPLRIFHESVKQSIFPDLVYHHVSGGDPRVIPELTYENWKAFHARHYHPSNSFFYTYGCFPLESTLEVLEQKVLAQFQKIDPLPPVSRQTSSVSPICRKFHFPVSQSDNNERKSIIAMVWKLAPITDFYTNLKLSLLSTIISGNNSALLSRTLLESGLGDGLAPIGYEDSYSESIFGIGLKDTDESSLEKIEGLILETLQQASENGFTENEINAALHQLEFGAKEIKGDHGIPFGLSLAFRGITPWICQGDFLMALNIDTFLDQLRRECFGKVFYRTMIQEFFLNNPHRVTVTLSPDPGGLERQEQHLQEKLRDIQSRLTPDDIQAILEQAASLKNHQEQTEDTTCLPKIDRNDISPMPAEIPQRLETFAGTRIYVHEIPTNGISYMTLAFHRTIQNNTLFPVFGFLGLLPELGAAGRNYIENMQRIEMHTGGISVRVLPNVHIQTGDRSMTLMISSRCLPRNHDAMLSLVHDLMFKADSGDLKRIHELIGMQKAYALPSVNYQAHRMAMLAAGRYLSTNAWIQHALSGLGFVQSILRMTPDAVTGYAKEIQPLLREWISLESMNAAITGLGADLVELNHRLMRFAEHIPANSCPYSTSNPYPVCQDYAPEAWIINTDVSYMCLSVPTVSYPHPDYSALEVLRELMELPMYHRIRAKGGAYGAFALYDSEGAVFSMLTYRDPHTAQSLDAFREVIQELAEGHYTDESLHHAIVETIRRFDVPPSPREKGIIAFIRTLFGDTRELQKKTRQSILSTSRLDIERVLSTYFANPDRYRIAAVTSDKTLRNAETSALNLRRIPVAE